MPTPSPTRQFATLVSPLESADEPRWLRQASAQQRRQLREHQVRGALARLHATQAYAALPSLYHYHRTQLMHLEASKITPATLLAVLAPAESATAYLTRLKALLQSADLHAAKQEAYLHTLREEFTIATLKGDLRKEGRQLLEWIVGAFSSSSAEFADEGPYIGTGVARCCALKLMGDLVLPDVLLLGPDQDDTPCVAFVPGHPRHPLKQYPTRASFFASLRHDLSSNDFQQYFSRFIPLAQQRQVLAACLGRAALLDLPMAGEALQQGLRTYVVEGMVQRVQQDAQCLIPTDAQHATRLKDFVADYATALETHLVAGAGVGIRFGEEDEGRAPADWVAEPRVTQSRVAQPQEVQPQEVQPTGPTHYRHWLPDLSGYRLDAAASPSGPPDEKGLYRVQQYQAIRLNQAFYRVEQASGSWRIVHPTATATFEPPLRHNGAGAWYHTLEQPLRWNRLSLLRRLGPLSSGFDDDQLLELARVSGVSNERLRQVYLRQAPVPELLAYVLRRARIREEVKQVMAMIAKGEPVADGYRVPLLQAFHDAVATYHGRSAVSRRRRSDDPTPAPCDQQCNPPPAELYAQWFSRLNRAITEHRYELAQLDTDNSVRELQRRYPRLPLSLAQRLFDLTRDRTLGALQTQTAPLPLALAEQALNLEYDARLTTALEGFTTPSSSNDDTFVLALRLLEYLEGWSAGTALLLRRGDRFGVPLAELGETDVETTSLYLDDEEGWSVSSATQMLLTQDTTEYGFYRALLYAIGETRSLRLGLAINEPERLYQRLREMAQARPARARLLLGMPVRRTWLSPPPALGIQSNPQPGDDDLFGQEPAPRRLGRLLTQHSLILPFQAVERYIDHLLRDNQPISPLVAQLELERRELDTGLDAWIGRSPNPEAHQQRTRTSAQLVHAWESRIALREDTLRLDNLLIGELPPLTVDLPAVNSLRIMDLSNIPNLATFLQRFPNLQRLELINLPLSELPQGLETRERLRSVNLSRTRLTPSTLSALGRLPNLNSLILNDMDLTTFTWTARDMARLTASGALQTLTLQHSRARFETGVFAALATLPELLTLNLSENQISLTPEDVNDLAGLQWLRSLDLSNNPLGRMPDVSRMQQLEEIDLSRLLGVVSDWPRGLESLPAMESADLRYVPITEVPEGAGRTRGLRMWSELLPDGMRERFEQEMSSVGNHANESNESMSEASDTDGSADEGPRTRDTHALRDAPRLFDGMSASDRVKATQLLALGESAVAEFFSLLLRMDVSPQSRQPQANMRTRIQALIRGAFAAELRAALHEQARQAVSCVDRDALVFSQMENLLHADQAMASATDDSAAAELIALATSHWRALRLKEHVTAQITGWRQAGHEIDYSEIELYFRIALAPSLNLRDQPQTQVFTTYTRWVTAAMLGTAYAAVRAPEEQLLPGYLHAQPYWQRYLESAHAERIQTINQWRDRVGEYLDAASTGEELPLQLLDGELQRLQQVLVSSGRLGALEPLPTRLELNSHQYRQAYDALLQLVEHARLQLTLAVLAAQPGPSSRR